MLGVITNEMISAETTMKLVRTGIRDRFSVVVSSQDAGSRKPDPEIFLVACRRAGADPEACLYVGDGLEVDALGARFAGMQGIWLNREQDEQSCDEVMVIHTLGELPSIVETHRKKDRR